MNRANQLRGKDFSYLLSLFTHKSQLKFSPEGNNSVFSLISRMRSVLTSDQLRFEAQLPSGNILASAQGLAKLAAFMANKGTLRNKEIISEHTWQAMHSDLVKRCAAAKLFMQDCQK